jgi:hypothetical protein
MFYDKDGKDIGYKVHQDWWWREGDPDRYRYGTIESDYPAQYFPSAEPPRIKEFVDTVLNYCNPLIVGGIKSLVEFGCAGGWYLKEFQDKNISVHAYDGSLAGVEQSIGRGVHRFNIGLSDLRYPMDGVWKRFDLAICTEVAEHLEPPFHGTLVYNLTTHSNLIWFSAEPPGTNQAHVGHPGEMPLEYWKALFAFFGFGCHMLSDEIFESTVWRGRCIFFNQQHYGSELKTKP